MKKALSSLLIVLLLLPILSSACVFDVFAETITGSCGATCTYTIDTAKKTLTISGTGEMRGYGYSSSVPLDMPWAYRTDIETLIIEEGITGIGAYCFVKCESIQSVSFPSTLRSIAGNAFQGCKGLKSIVLPDGLEYVSGFNGCTSLESVKIGSETKGISSNAFYACKSLRSIEIPEGVTHIYNNAFYECPLQNVVLPDSVEYIGESAFFGGVKSIDLPDHVRYIGEDAFLGTSVLKRRDGAYYVDDYLIKVDSYIKEYVIPEGTKGIAAKAFYKNNTLTSLVIPSSVEAIGGTSFSGCSALKTVTFSEGLRYLNAYAFSNCTALESVTLPNSLKEMENSVFYGCSALSSIVLPDSLVAIGSNILKNTPYEKTETNWENGILYYGTYLLAAKEDLSGVVTVKDGTTLIVYEGLAYLSDVTEIVLPESLAYLGEGAFSGSEITKITVPGSVHTLPIDVFYECESLTEVTLQDGLVEICNWAFEGCTELASIVIPDTVTYIGQGAFEDCESLTHIKLSESLTVLDDEVFLDCGALKLLYIPASVEKVGEDVISGTSLEKVYYGGTAADFEEVEVDAINYTWNNCEIVMHPTHTFTEKVEDAYYLKELLLDGTVQEYYKSCVCGLKGADTFLAGDIPEDSTSENTTTSPDNPAVPPAETETSGGNQGDNKPDADTHRHEVTLVPQDSLEGYETKVITLQIDMNQKGGGCGASVLSIFPILLLIGLLPILSKKED